MTYGFFDLKDNRFLLWLGVTMIAISHVRSLADFIFALGVSMIVFSVTMLWAGYKCSVEKRLWNNGVCPASGEPWKERFHVGKGVGYVSSKQVIWLKYYRPTPPTEK